MNTREELEDFIKNGDKVYLPHFTIDCVIFGYENRQLKVLLCKWIGLGWGLPGGYVKHEESLTDAANRILMERTALDNVFLKQFHTFGDSLHRIKGYKSENWYRLPEDSWLIKRTLSIGYYALMDCSKAIVKRDFLSEDHKWVDVREIPDDLILEQKEVIKYALEALRNQIFHEPIGYNLLPKKFTLPEIHTLYETILDKTLDRRNFPNKLLAQEIIVKLNEKRLIGQHRAPFLYMFHKGNYDNALNSRVVLVL
jgi:8-oxo-dGTP diphosphatase